MRSIVRTGILALLVACAGSKKPAAKAPAGAAAGSANPAELKQDVKDDDAADKKGGGFPDKRSGDPCEGGE